MAYYYVTMKPHNQKNDVRCEYLQSFGAFIGADSDYYKTQLNVIIFVLVVREIIRCCCHN